MICIYSIRQVRAPRMDTQKYHREMEVKLKKTTEALRQEVKLRKSLSCK
jgi:hypothetical protein